MADDFSLDALASAVAERAPIDWDQAEQSARDDSERAAVKALHVVAKMTEVVLRLTPHSPQRKLNCS